MKNSPADLRCIYSFLSICYPDYLKSSTFNLPDTDLVAASLITSLHENDAKVSIKTIDNQTYVFDLDLKNKVFQSKGNWLWIKQVDIYYPKELLFSLVLKPRVIDLPYAKNRICSHWLMRNVKQELNDKIEDYLQRGVKEQSQLD